MDKCDGWDLHGVLLSLVKMQSSCEVCSSEPSKYRCPTCALMRYELRPKEQPVRNSPANSPLRNSCSLACTQSHKIYCAPKATSANRETSDPSIDAQLPNGTDKDGNTENFGKRTDPLSSATIAASSEITELLHRHPQLRSQLHDIYRGTQEEEWVEWYNPPSRGRPHGRGGKPPARRSRGPWTAEKGFNRGLGRVRKLRQDCDAGTESGATAEAFMHFLALANNDQQTQHRTRQDC